MCDRLTVHPNALLSEVKQRLTNSIEINQLESTTGKLRLYRKIKNKFIYENYLDFPLHLRDPPTKLRISNHSLRIENERFNLPPVPVDDRKCFFCNDAIEDELHFLFECKYYHDLDEYFQS